MAVAGDDCQTIYVSADQRGFYRSADAGQTWEGPLAIEGLPSHRVRSLEVAHDDSRIVLARTDRGLFRTTDGGDSWDLVVDVGRPHIVAFSPRSGAPDEPLWMQSWGTGLWRNDGGSWAPVADYPGSYGARVDVSPHDPNHVIADIYRSTDGGATWADTGINHVTRALWNPDDPSEVIITSYTQGVFRSLDGGATFEAINDNLTDLYAPATLIEVQDAAFVDGELLIGTLRRGLFASEDHAGGWVQVLPETDDNEARRIESAGDEAMALVVGLGVYHYADGQWTKLNAGLGALENGDVIRNDQDGYWYLTSRDGLFRSTGTEPWALVDERCPGAQFSALRHAAGGTYLVASTGDGVHMTALP